MKTTSFNTLVDSYLYVQYSATWTLNPVLAMAISTGLKKEHAMSDIQNTPLTFEKVWAALMENKEQMKEYARQQTEMQAKYQAEHAKYQAEYATYQAEHAKRQKELDKQMQRTDEQMGFLSNRFGELAEHLVAPNIHERFNELGNHFDGVAPGGYIVRDEQGKIKTEIDLLLENGETIMAVEIKAKPTLKHIEHHIKRLEILSDFRRKKNDRRKIQGAIAGAIFGVMEKKATLEAGFYVIEQSGDTVKIEIPESFSPRSW